MPSSAGMRLRPRMINHPSVPGGRVSSSMASGLKVLARQYGARLAVLGHMGELGEDSDDLHRQVGAAAAKLGLPLLTVSEAARMIGEGYQEAGARDYAHANDSADALAQVLQRTRVGPQHILVKASRSAGLEDIVHGLLDEISDQEQA